MPRYFLWRLSFNFFSQNLTFNSVFARRLFRWKALPPSLIILIQPFQVDSESFFSFFKGYTLDGYCKVASIAKFCESVVVMSQWKRGGARAEPWSIFRRVRLAGRLSHCYCEIMIFNMFSSRFVILIQGMTLFNWSIQVSRHAVSSAKLRSMNATEVLFFCNPAAIYEVRAKTCPQQFMPLLNPAWLGGITLSIELYILLYICHSRIF